MSSSSFRTLPPTSASPITHSSSRILRFASTPASSSSPETAMRSARSAYWTGSLATSPTSSAARSRPSRARRSPCSSNVGPRRCSSRRCGSPSSFTRRPPRPTTPRAPTRRSRPASSSSARGWAGAPARRFAWTATTPGRPRSGTRTIRTPSPSSAGRSNRWDGLLQTSSSHASPRPASTRGSRASRTAPRRAPGSGRWWSCPCSSAVRWSRSSVSSSTKRLRTTSASWTRWARSARSSAVRSSATAPSVPSPTASPTSTPSSTPRPRASA